MNYAYGDKTRIAFIDKKPLCGFCSGQNIEGKVLNPNASKASWDGPTRMGPWSYMCNRHLQSAGYLGSSMNLRLVERKAA